MSDINENEEFKTRIIEVTDENGDSYELELLDIIDIEGVEYALLSEVDEDYDEDNDDEQDDSETEAVVMRLIRNGDEFTFEAIEDDEEFNIVSEYIDSLEE